MKNITIEIKKYSIYKLTVGCVFFMLFSCEEIILEDNISDKEVVLIAPVNNTQFFSTSVTFTWESIENASKYRLQIAKPNFANPTQIVLDTLVSKNNFTNQLNIGDYEWRVKALNSAYETLYNYHYFTIVNNEDFKNNTVVQLAPSANLITNVLAQNLSWQSVIGATNYQIQIYDTNNTIIKDEVITSTNLNYIFPEGNYQWRVRASNATEQTLYSSRRILIDNTKPNTPVIISPLNLSSQTAGGNIDFKWSRIPISGSEEKDSIYIYKNITLTDLFSKKESSSPYTTTLTAGTYYWSVKSFDMAGNIGTQSTVFSIIVN